MSCCGQPWQPVPLPEQLLLLHPLPWAPGELGMKRSEQSHPGPGLLQCPRSDPGPPGLLPGQAGDPRVGLREAPPVVPAPRCLREGALSRRRFTEKHGAARAGGSP